jgi:hypothetical protein
MEERVIILIDLNGVVIASIVANLKTEEISEDLIRHMVLNTIRTYSKQFRTAFGKVVICCDNKHYWRRDRFPLYKANRKKARDSSKLNWGLIFDTLEKVREEIKLNMPYRVMNVDGAEADDVIAVLAAEFHESEPVLIVSSDKDFMQLQKYKGVQQYSPYHEKFMRIDDPHAYLKEHIICGDADDGVPNIRSPDNVFLLEGVRQKPIRKTKLAEWVQQSPNEFCDTEMMAHYVRNRELIDFDFVPVELTDRILEEFDSLVTPPKSKMFHYFVDKGLEQLMQSINDF